ncbi:hypothetical protein RhiirC2_784927 [Rhizophagus irregularis]|uniref:Uncharacterized protein n=1 Tax=Rhizophagus irregularis TaxID=588596 RepID=A0A2N1MXE8_9GLOM|nr:hypothetical protein RhiirC2_784927 [Rhizophagus irregularis]
MSSHLSVTFDESSLRSNSSSPTSSYTPSFDSSVSEDFRFHQRSGSLVKWTFFVICMEYRDSVIQKYNSKEILSANEELPNLHIPHQEENQQELRDYFDDELWQDMKFTLNIRSRTCLQFIACQQQDFRQRRTEIKNFLKNYLTDGVLEKIMHNILSSLASRTSGSSSRTKKRFDPSLAGSKPDLTRIDVCRNKTIQSTCRPDKPGSGNFCKTMRALKDCLLDLIVCGLHVIASLNGINWRIHVPEGPTTWGNSWMFFRLLITIWLIGSREQGGQSFTQGRATQKNSQKLKIKNMMLSFSN